jgi:hypothetical protein
MQTREPAVVGFGRLKDDHLIKVFQNKTIQIIGDKFNKLITIEDKEFDFDLTQDPMVHMAELSNQCVAFVFTHQCASSLVVVVDLPSNHQAQKSLYCHVSFLSVLSDNSLLLFFFDESPTLFLYKKNIIFKVKIRNMPVFLTPPLELPNGEFIAMYLSSIYLCNKKFKRKQGLDSDVNEEYVLEHMTLPNQRRASITQDIYHSGAKIFRALCR